MRHYHDQKNPGFCPTVNVENLWSLVGKEARAQAEATKENGKLAGKALLLDLTQHGIFKVLGRGRLPDIPLVVKARFVSQLAEEKIKKAGGAVVLTA